jgi:arabinose-5-phosphate isomerase
MRDQELIEYGQQVIKLEAEAIENLIPKIDSSFVNAVKLIRSCEGRVVVTGTGKSGQIARKIAATLASTGTPSFFLHAVEGVHGDLGMIVPKDVVIALSNSGETEVVQILPVLKRIGVPIIAMTGNKTSTLANASEIILDVSIKEEACPMGLAPTSSTTATLAMGDALAVALLKDRGFDEKDFALRHPGGKLGKRLLLTVDELMHSGNELPLIFPHTSMREAIVEISSKMLGLAGVIDSNKNLVGIITDGDLRRNLEKHQDLLDLSARDILTENPKSIFSGELAEKALQIMERHRITSLFIVKRDYPRRPIGILHLHDLLKAKIV